MNHQPASILSFTFLAFAVVMSTSAKAVGNDRCDEDSTPFISFVEYQSLDLTQDPPVPLTIKAKLSLPPLVSKRARCYVPRRRVPAVVIMHGSNGVDFRGDFYARGLNARGIATLDIDMWEARGVSGIENRPSLPLFNYPDAFAALAYLTARPEIHPDRIGALGFSWGGVITVAAAEELYATQFGGGLEFAAHVANYPVCYAFNNPDLATSVSIAQNLEPPLVPATAGVQWVNLTGAPVLIQTGTEDDYDNGAENCFSLIDDLVDPEDAEVVEVVAYEGAVHAWDRLQVPVTVPDSFADEGSVFVTGLVPLVRIIPDVAQANESRRKVVNFFRKNL
ncbi:MAG: dienelactone hydrolase family protein [Pseudomonadota bacterium]